MLLRAPDWHARLSAYLMAHRDQPFVWGERDCSLFFADAVVAMGGPDLAEGLRGYSSALSAERILRANGGLVAIVDARLPRRADPRDLQTGDCGLVVVDGREFLAVVYNQWAISPGPERAAMNLAMNCTIGWAV